MKNNALLIYLTQDSIFLFDKSAWIMKPRSITHMLTGSIAPSSVNPSKFWTCFP